VVGQMLREYGSCISLEWPHTTFPIWFTPSPTFSIY
jgi:hypothetical protein